MGYQSDIILCLSKKGYDNILEKMKNFDDYDKDFVENTLYFDSEKCLEGKGEVLFSLKNITLSNWEYLWNLISDVLESSDYSFVRIGDDPVDIEREGSFMPQESFIFYPVTRIHLEVVSDTVKDLKPNTKQPDCIL